MASDKKESESMKTSVVTESNSVLPNGGIDSRDTKDVLPSTIGNSVSAVCADTNPRSKSSDGSKMKKGSSNAVDKPEARNVADENENTDKPAMETKCADPEICTVETSSVKRVAKFNTGQNYQHGDSLPVQRDNIGADASEHVEHHYVKTCSCCGQILPRHGLGEADDQIWYTDLSKADDQMYEHFRTSMNFELIIDSPKNVVCLDNLGFVLDDTEELASKPRTAEGSVNRGTKTDIRRPSSVSRKKQAHRLLQQVIIVLGGCFNVLLGLGFPLSLGALYVDWLETFGSTHAETSIIQSTCSGLTLMGGVVVGFLIRRFGIRLVLITGSLLTCIGLVASFFATSHIFLIISIGVVMGCGCSMLFLASNVNVTLAFAHGRVKSFALALIIMSGGVGMMIFPPLLQELKLIYGWRGALLIMGGVFLNVIVSALIVTSPLCDPSSPHGKNEPASPERKKVKWSRLLNPLYFAYLLCAMVGFGTITATALTTVDYSLSKGLSSEQGILYLFLINTCTTVSRLLAGLALLVPGIESTHIYGASYLVGGAALIVLSLSDSYVVNTACFAVYGFGSGGMVATYGAGILNAVGEDIFAVTMGLGGVVSGLSFTTFGIIIGTLYDLLGSYDLAFRIFGCMSAGASIFFFLVNCIKAMRHHKTVPISPVETTE